METYRVGSPSEHLSKGNENEAGFSHKLLVALGPKFSVSLHDHGLSATPPASQEAGSSVLCSHSREVLFLLLRYLGLWLRCEEASKRVRSFH